jgi:hypothetical protein
MDSKVQQNTRLPLDQHPRADVWCPSQFLTPGYAAVFFAR